MMHRAAALFIPAMSLIFCSCSAGNAASSVKNSAELERAISSSKGGEEIILEPGSYDLNIYNRDFSVPIVIISKDGRKNTIISRGNIGKSKNITVKDVQIGRALQDGEPEYTALFSIRESENIKIENVDIHGSLDGNPQNDGFGLFIVDTSGIIVDNSKFHELVKGVIFTRSSRVRLTSNKFFNIGSDGSDFTAVTGVVIDSNCYTNFSPKDGDHPDAIQFWNRSAQIRSTDVKITNNQMIQGDGGGFQGVFVGAEDADKRYGSFIVSNNLLFVQDQYNGISFGDTDDVIIQGNTVISTPDSRSFWIRLDNVNRATVRNNVSDQIRFDNSKDIQSEYNIDLSRDRAYISKIPGIHNSKNANPRDLILPGHGYSGEGLVCN